jgi:MFS family permease
MPLAGYWSDRLGRRRSYCLGAAMLATGLLASGWLPDFGVLILARALTGAGYAILFMSCQGHVLDQTSQYGQGGRTEGMAGFVAAIMVAEICAPAVGGILADRVGYGWVFTLGAGSAALGCLLAWHILSDVPQHISSAAKLHWQGLLRNRRFLAISLLTAIPAKLLYSAFLIYLVPLLLSEYGSSKA